MCGTTVARSERWVHEQATNGLKQYLSWRESQVQDALQEGRERMMRPVKIFGFNINRRTDASDEAVQNYLHVIDDDYTLHFAGISFQREIDTCRRLIAGTDPNASCAMELSVADSVILAIVSGRGNK